MLRQENFVFALEMVTKSLSVKSLVLLLSLMLSRWGSCHIGNAQRLLHRSSWHYLHYRASHEGGVSSSSEYGRCYCSTSSRRVDDFSPSHQNSNGGSHQDFLLWLGCLDYDLDCLDFELDFIYGIYKSYKYEHTNLLAPLTMLSFNHQNHNHGQMRSFSFPRDKCGHGMLLPSNTDIKITRICVLDFCRHDSYKVENYIGWLHCQGICSTTYKVAASLLI